MRKTKTVDEVNESIERWHLEQAVSRFKFLENKALDVDLSSAELDEILKIAHLVERASKDLGLSEFDLAGMIDSATSRTRH